MWKVSTFEGLPTHFVESFQIFRSETWSNAEGNSGTLFVAGKHTKFKRMLTDPMSTCECLISTQEVAVGVTSFLEKELIWATILTPCCHDQHCSRKAVFATERRAILVGDLMYVEGLTKVLC
jgi:hypothetical protein